MATSFLNICIQALGLCGKASPAPAAQDIDAGLQKYHVYLRSYFPLVYSNLVDQRGSEFSREYDLAVNSSSNEYSLPYSTARLLQIDNVRLISPVPEKSRIIDYLPESEGEKRYPNPLDIQKGEISRWYIDQGATAGQRVIRFIDAPNENLIVRFNLSDPALVLTANDLTQCTIEGDRYLIYSLAAFISLKDEKMEEVAKFERLALRAYNAYKMIETNIEVEGENIVLYQH